MGDLCDQADIERILRSPEGQTELAEIRRSLVNRRITNVHFTNLIHCAGIEIELDDEEIFCCQLPELDVDAIRQRFEVVLDREYDKDYPERK